MASLRLEVPENFDFRSPDDWPRWKKRFEQFCLGSGLAGEDEERQTSTLLYCLGGEAEDVLGSTNITEGERKQYSKVLEKFDSHFQVRRNLIFERARFNKCDQREGESAEQYITALYQLAERCEYRDFKLVVGIRNTSLSEKLQMDAALTLEKAKRLIRQHEAVHEQ